MLDNKKEKTAMKLLSILGFLTFLGGIVSLPEVASMPEGESNCETIGCHAGYKYSTTSGGSYCNGVQIMFYDNGSYDGICECYQGICGQSGSSLSNCLSDLTIEVVSQHGCVKVNGAYDVFGDSSTGRPGCGTYGQVISVEIWEEKGCTGTKCTATIQAFCKSCGLDCPGGGK